MHGIGLGVETELGWGVTRVMASTSGFFFWTWELPCSHEHVQEDGGEVADWVRGCRADLAVRRVREDERMRQLSGRRRCDLLLYLLAEDAIGMTDSILDVRDDKGEISTVVMTGERLLVGAWVGWTGMVDVVCHRGKRELREWVSMWFLEGNWSLCVCRW